MLSREISFFSNSRYINDEHETDGSFCIFVYMHACMHACMCVCACVHARTHALARVCGGDSPVDSAGAVAETDCSSKSLSVVASIMASSTGGNGFARRCCRQSKYQQVKLVNPILKIVYTFWNNLEIVINIFCYH